MNALRIGSLSPSLPPSLLHSFPSFHLNCYLLFFFYTQPYRPHMFWVLHRWAFNDYLIQWLWAVLQTVDSKSVPSFLLTNRDQFFWVVNLSTKKKTQKSLTWGHVYISGQWAVSRNLFHIIFQKHVLCQLKRCSFRGHVCLLSSLFPRSHLEYWCDAGGSAAILWQWDGTAER